MLPDLTKKFSMDRSALSVETLSDQDKTEAAEYAAMTPHERLEILELLRQLHYGYDACAGRLQRVLEITELESE